MKTQLKQQLAQQAIQTLTPEDSLATLYAIHNLTPENHINVVTNHEYTNNNIWCLELSMLLNNFNSSQWATFAQYKTVDKHIKKGSKSTKICIAVHNKKKDEDTKEEKQVFKFFKGGSVFNVDQVENIN